MRPVRILALSLLLLPQGLAAAIITVGGGCTLADAIDAANSDTATGLCSAGSGADEIQLTADVTLTQVDNTIDEETGTAGGPNGLPQVVSEIVIEGNGHTIARGAGAPEFRIFSVDFPGNLTIRNTTLSNGGGAAFDYLGGAVANAFGADLTLIDCTVSGNSAGGFFGGGGGIYNGGDAVLTGTTISGNSAYIGGGLANSGIATVTNSTLSDNSGGEDKGGAIDNTGTVTLVNSTLSANTAGAAGAGALNVFSGPAYLTNTLMAGNFPVNCKTGSGSVNNAGNNLADDTTCGTIPGTLVGLEAALLDNGGPTMTHALLAGSNAEDAGSAADCPVTDQRGAPRVGTCDIGAFEFVPCPDLTLTSEIVSGPQSRENCQQIVVGPDFSVDGTGDLTLRAGRSIVVADTTSVVMDGRLTLEIEPDLQLLPSACPPGWSDCNANPGCETQNPVNDACSVAMNLGTVTDWDGSGPVELALTSQIIVPGASLWFKVHAADPPGDDWKLLAKLFAISSGLDLDLHAYRRSSGNSCSSTPPVPSGSCNENISGCGGNRENSNRCSTNSGNGSECVSWFESCTGLLESDETEVWIEVRHVSGGCGTFDLKVRNNGNNDSFTCANY